jgi:hypothetical protein
MAGEYSITFTTGGGKSGFTIYPGEINGPNASNNVQIAKADTTYNQFLVNGDFSFRFTAGVSFNVSGSYGAINDGMYVVSSNSVYQAPLVYTVTGANQIQIAGDYRAIFKSGRAFSIEGANSNNGRWMLRTDATFSGGATVIAVKTTALGDTIPSGINDPNLLAGNTFLVGDSGVVKTYITAISVAPSIPQTLVANTATPPGKIVYNVPASEVKVDLSFPGRGYQDYGQVMIENMVHMLENFYGPTQPAHGTYGQLWYDSAADKLKVLKPSGWTIVV